jgi:hypothetical protein
LSLNNRPLCVIEATLDGAATASASILDRSHRCVPNVRQSAFAPGGSSLGGCCEHPSDPLPALEFVRAGFEIHHAGIISDRSQAPFRSLTRIQHMATEPETRGICVLWQDENGKVRFLHPEF